MSAHEVEVVRIPGSSLASRESVVVCPRIERTRPAIGHVQRTLAFNRCLEKG